MIRIKVSHLSLYLILPSMEIAGRRDDFYHACLGGELVFRQSAILRSRKKCLMPWNMSSCILPFIRKSYHYGQRHGRRKGLRKGNAVSSCSHVEAKKICIVVVLIIKWRYEGSSSRTNFQGNIFGDLTDKFGNHWLLNCSQTKAIIWYLFTQTTTLI